jgi:hypothetical protein
MNGGLPCWEGALMTYTYAPLAQTTFHAKVRRSTLLLTIMEASVAAEQ